MTTITITRHYSGLNNVEDTFEIGNHERDGRASLADYLVPDGYSYDANAGVIRDSAGVECAIVLHSSGRPQLVSLAGSVTKQPVLAVA